MRQGIGEGRGSLDNEGTASARRYVPGLDGLRAAAVVAVLVFHAGRSGARGGFLGVSLFFTLSGFLITGLLMDEHATSGRIRLGAFWARRLRRLMPASLLCLGLVLVVSHGWIEPALFGSLRSDVTAAALDVANWRFVGAHQSYAELFARTPSPVLHFWSLAIEEQYYFVYPVVVALLLRARRAWALPLGLLVLIAASIVAAISASSHDLVYYGTHTRAAELLIGGLLAWVVSRPATSIPIVVTPRLRVAGQFAAFAAGGGFLTLIVHVAQSDAWLYDGGFALLALLWCVVIVAARTPGPFATMVGWSPLAAIGRRSYGVYLFHWPVFTLVTPDRLGIHGWPARLAQVLIIAAVTQSSYRWLEQPVRHRRVASGRIGGPAVAFGCVSAVLVGAAVMPTPSLAGAGSTVSMVDAPDQVVHLTAAPTPSKPMPSGPAALGGTSIPATDASSVTSPASDASATSVPEVAGSVAPHSTTGRAETTTDTTEVTNLVVVGSVVEVARQLANVSSPTMSLDDRTGSDCPVINVSATAVSDGSCLLASGADRHIDTLVVTIGDEERSQFQRALAGGPGVDPFAVAQALRLNGVAELERLAGRADRTVIVTVPAIDATPAAVVAADFVDSIIGEAVLSTPSMSTVTADQLSIGALGVGNLTPPGAGSGGAALKVMVIGDSTSYGVAQGLSQSSGSDGGALFDVVWAGKRNCPFARMEAIKWLTDAEFSMTECPSITSVWPDQIASFRPDVVLIVEGLPEQSVQRYAGDPTWYEAGDARFDEVHDADFGGLMDLAASVGAVVVLADQPHDAPDDAAVWSTNERIDGWNAKLRQWDDAWTAVSSLSYGPAIEAAEAAAGHSLRPDGLHLEDSAVTAIFGGALAPQLRDSVTELRSTLAASGCIVRNEDGAAQLDLAHCH